MKLFNTLCALGILMTVAGCKTTPKKPIVVNEGSSISTIQSITEHIERDNADIKQDATSINVEAQQVDEVVDKIYETVPPEVKPNLDIVTDSVAEIKNHSEQIINASERIQEETNKLEEVTAQVKAVEVRVQELQKTEEEIRGKAMEKLYGYISLFWVIGFIIIAAGVALAFFLNKTMGTTITIVGGIMIGFASASQYYLKEIALVGGILLVGLIVFGLGIMIWTMIKAKRSDIAIREIVEMIEILKETMTESENLRIFGPDGVAAKVQSDLTKEIISKIKERNGFKRLEEARKAAQAARQQPPDSTPS